MARGRDFGRNMVIGYGCINAYFCALPVHLIRLIYVGSLAVCLCDNEKAYEVPQVINFPTVNASTGDVREGCLPGYDIYCFLLEAGILILL